MPGPTGLRIFNPVHQCNGLQILLKAPLRAFLALQNAEKVRQFVHIGVLDDVVTVSAVMLKACLLYTSDAADE